MSKENPQIQAEQLLELALKSGAQFAEVYQTSEFSKPIFFEANRLKQLESIESEGIALRLWCNQKPGLAVGYGAVDLSALVEKAIALSALNEIETVELTPRLPLEISSYPNLGSWISVETLIDWGKEAINLILNQYPEVLCSSQWECESQTIRLINSLGLDCSYTDITLNAHLAAEWVRGEDFLTIYQDHSQRELINPIELANQIIQRLEWSQQNVSPPIGGVPILFTPKATDLLWDTIIQALNGKRVIEHASPWSDRLGELITSKEITISQNPKMGPYSCPFDDEGTPTRSLVFIDRGVLSLFYTDHKIGKLLGSGSTGNGFRPSLGSYPSPELFNLIVQPGLDSFSELVAKLDSGIIIDQTLGGTAGISGDFSVNVDLGFRVEKGQLIGRVKDTMVAGNVYHALKELIAKGSDVQWNAHCSTPSIIVDSLSVTGEN